MTREQLATEAQRIKESEALQMALQRMKDEAFAALAGVNPDDPDTIRTHQATVRCVDDFLGEIEGMILNGAEKKKAPIA